MRGIHRCLLCLRGGLSCNGGSGCRILGILDHGLSLRGGGGRRLLGRCRSSLRHAHQLPYLVCRATEDTLCARSKTGCEPMKAPCILDLLHLLSGCLGTGLNRLTG
jgi:hypothetical protein